MAQYDVDVAVGMYAGIFNNPFMIWGKYRNGFMQPDSWMEYPF